MGKPLLRTVLNPRFQAVLLYYSFAILAADPILRHTLPLVPPLLQPLPCHCYSLFPAAAPAGTAFAPIPGVRGPY